MVRALIGSTGFVGGTLLRQAPFEEQYHSANIHSIAGRSFDLLVCAGVRAEKWRANQDPAGDRASIQKLTDALETVRARLVVLISTVDVYPDPVEVDEDSPIDPSRATVYGRHRYDLERWFADRFETLIVRLPGLFGPGLRKNVVYDLLNENQIHMINPASVYQYYNLVRLWTDVQRAQRKGLRVVNFATEPLPTVRLLSDIFGRSLPWRPGPAAHYDFRSRYAGVFGGSDGYLYPREQIVAELRQFVRQESRRKAA